jgi:hypothetical protein
MAATEIKIDPRKPAAGTRGSGRSLDCHLKSVKILRITIFVCPVSNQEYEVTRYAATLKVRNGNRQETVQATGDCGS